MLKEAYGKQSHVSSKDEDWSVESTAKKAKKDDNKREHGKLPGAKAQSADNRRSLDIEGKIEDDNGIDMPNLDQPQVSKATSESTPDKGHENLVEQCDGDQLLGLDGNTISKWFENARHNLRVSAKGSDLPGTSGAAVSDKGTDHARTSMYKGNPFMEPSRKNSESSKGNAESSAGSNEKISRKANNHKDQVGSGAGDQLKRTVDSKRQMAVARELRKMRNNSR
ncbi:hypothetical protein BHM03_00041646 [Ensete ventricosum]|nr:hypothetical protein BHM03_00041646 [Ensete ventricosum]